MKRDETMPFFLMKQCGMASLFLIKQLRPVLLVLLLSLHFGGKPVPLMAAEDRSEEYLKGLLNELDLGKMDAYTRESLPEPYTFSKLVKDLLEEYSYSAGKKGRTDWKSNIGRMVLDIFFYEIRAVRPLLVEILLIALVFSVAERLCISRSEYLSGMTFFAVYGTLVLLLMRAFLLVSDIAVSGLTAVIAFLKVLVPLYAATLLLSGNLASAGIFYEMTFGLVFVVESAMKYVFFPLIHIFVLFEFLNRMWEENKLSKLCELLESGVGLFTKVAVGAIIGLSTVQSLVGTASDRLSGNAVWKTLSAIPGIGNAAETGGEILLGCGILLKNSIGVAGVIVIFVVCLVPIIKIFVISFLFHLIAAVLQPAAKPQITDCIQSVARGSALYLKLMVVAMLLFIIVISVITTATSFIY